MSYDLALHTTNGAIARQSRRVARGVCHVQGDGQIRQADIDTEADVTDGKLGAVTSGTMHAMTAVANVARLEMVLAQNFPVPAVGSPTSRKVTCWLPVTWLK
jgi:hypothetical protein